MTTQSEVPESVRRATEAVRSGDEPIYARLRRLFAERDLDVSTTLFDYWAEDTALLEGFAVTVTGGVYKWDFDFLDRERVEAAPEKGTFSNWQEVTDEPSEWYPGELVQRARAFTLAGGRLK
jgi:hypothetical protein